VEGGEERSVPDHGPRAQHGAGDGLLDDASGYAWRRGRVPRNGLASEQLPATRRLPYADYGIILAQDITGSGTQQTVSTASYGANRLGLEAGRFIHIDLGGANEEYVQMLAVDPGNQTFEAVVTGDHLAGENVRPAIWPTPILNEGDDLAFDILSVASPDPGSDLTVVIQT
jgi:hypothetical protein